MRIVCATNKKLEQMVKEGKFREDLYFRLNVIPIVMPALRDRKEDLPLLINHFIEKYCQEMSLEKKSLSASARRILQEYSYPGNVRELENIIEYAVALSSGDVINDTDLPRNVQEQQPILSSSEMDGNGNFLKVPVGVPMSEVERKSLQQHSIILDGIAKKQLRL